jgi:hypothetical protein
MSVACGTCFRDAFAWIREHGEGGFLVHGRVGVPAHDHHIRNHAWVEFDDGTDYMIIDPVTGMEAMRDDLEAKGVHYTRESVYTPTEAVIMGLRTGNYGKWYESEVIDILGRAIVDDPDLLEEA